MKTELYSRLFQTAAFATALVITGSLTPNSVQAQTSIYENAILSYGPAGYWPLTETSGTTAYDLTGNNNGTYINCTLGQPGLPDSEGIGTNTSVHFSGADAYVDIPGSGNLNIEGPVTVIQWIQAPVGGDTTFVTTLGHSDSSYRLDVVPQAHFACPSPDVVYQKPLNDGKWHMLAGVFDGSAEYLYVDGYLVASVAESGIPFSDDDVWIGGAPDYGNRFFTGNICQVAIIPSALGASDIIGLLYSLETAPQISISPSAPSIYAGSDLQLTTTVLGNPALGYQWFQKVSGVTNLISGATNSTYTIQNAPLSDNGAVFGVIATNDYGTNSASVTLAVVNGPAYIAQDISPLTAEALVGTPITYTVGAAGTMPLYYQWTVNGTKVAGATASTFTTLAVAGNNNLQVTVTNAQSGGSPAVSSVAMVTGDTTPVSLGFDSGDNWTLNTDGFGSVPSFTSADDLELTDGGGSEASSAFYNLAEYVAGFTASFTYTAQDAEADGTCFIIQNSTTGVRSLGAAGGSLGFAGASPDITNSVALEIDLYTSVGIAIGTNGNTFATDSILYGPTGGIYVDSGDPITFDLAYTNSVLYVNMTDQFTAVTYSTNYNIGPMDAILGGTDLAYVGFSGATGGLASIQDVTDFAFQPIAIAPPTAPPLSGLLTNGNLQLSWPTNSAGFTVQYTTNLTPPVTWISASGSPTLNGSSYVQTVTNAPKPASFFRLIYQ